MEKKMDPYLREEHFNVRIPLLVFSGFVLCACETASWTQTGWIVAGLLTFALLTHRLHNKAAEWVYNNTDYTGP